FRSVSDDARWRSVRVLRATFRTFLAKRLWGCPALGRLRGLNRTCLCLNRGGNRTARDLRPQENEHARSQKQWDKPAPHVSIGVLLFDISARFEFVTGFEFRICAPAQMNPRFGVEKRPRLGKTVARLLLSTPNQVASVAKY